MSHRFANAARQPLAGLILLLILPGTAVRAQGVRDTVSLPEMVVTATRYPVAPDSVATTLTVLKGEDLRAQGIRFVGDALRQVPGVQVVQSGSFGATTSLFVRGGESDYVKVLVDGMPVNDPGGAFDLGSLAIDNVERIEIVRGPASVLYGSDAISGVVQIITRKGAGSTALEASGEAGSYGTVRWEGAVRGGISGFGWSGSVSRLTSDGIYPFNNNYGNTVGSALLQARAGAGTEATLALRYHDGTFDFPTDFTGAPVLHNQFSTEKVTTISLDVSQRLASQLKGQLLLGRNVTSRGYDNRDTLGGTPEFSTSLATITRRTVDARLLFSGIPHATVMGGAAFDDQHEEDVSSSDGPFGPSDDTFKANRHNWGFYLQGSAQPVHRLELTAGGRLDDNQRFGQFWTYRVAALGFLSSSTRVRASVGSGFKEPSFFESFATGFVIGNPNLKPEHSTNFEAGLEQDLAAGHIGLSLTGFVQHFRDLIQYTGAPPVFGDPNYFNVAAARASGLEAGLQVRRIGPVEGGVSYTRLRTLVTDAGFDTGPDAQFVGGQRLIRRPQDAVTARVQAAVAARLQVGAVLSYVGSRDDLRFAQFPDPTRRVELPAYATLDLSSRWTALAPRGRTPGLWLSARAENLFDKRYEQVVNFPSRGRTIIVGLATSVR